MSHVVQIDAVRAEKGKKLFNSQSAGRTLFNSRNAGKTLFLRDDRGATLEVTLEDYHELDERRRPGGPVRIFEAFIKELDGTRTFFRYATLKVYKGYGYSVVLLIQ